MVVTVSSVISIHIPPNKEMRQPHIPLPFKEVIADVLKVKPPEKAQKPKQTIPKKRGSAV
jgi:hypothetical protein